MTDASEGEIVVFLIGMRINRLRAPRAWLPVFRAMPRMLRELSRDPSAGMLGYRLLFGGPRIFCVVQYWESQERLHAYASSPEREHRPAWAAFHRRARRANGAVGIWHESYRVPPGHYESVYVDMPAFGLGAARGTAPVGQGGARAADRLRSRAG
ncbi:DUF4188 domain-containing protein [Streptomyces sp. AJS327]|uniref:DUF4188 domain-containing protein n=1 Tax=Streptomyces sp. AJS327 TaxID=2545265 RepID=UPI0015E05ECF|nr:DUF4188 domain-containing protein [Streptomyces sp. AJS327]MBA0051769.1 DUF4188 domain-containing protein [Streptomyces sp. AJS327]